MSLDQDIISLFSMGMSRIKIQKTLNITSTLMQEALDRHPNYQMLCQVRAARIAKSRITDYNKKFDNFLDSSRTQRESLLEEQEKQEILRKKDSFEKLKEEFGELYKKWAEGHSVMELSQSSGYSIGVLSNRFSRFPDFIQVKNTRVKISRQSRKDPSTDYILELYKQGYTLRELGEKLGVTYQAIQSRLSRNPEYFKYIKFRKESRNTVNPQEVMSRWANGETQTHLAVSLGVSLRIIKDTLISHPRYQEVKSTRKSIVIWDKANAMLARFREGATLSQITTEFKYAVPKGLEGSHVSGVWQVLTKMPEYQEIIRNRKTPE